MLSFLNHYTYFVSYDDSYNDPYVVRYGLGFDMADADKLFTPFSSVFLAQMESEV